MRSAPVKAIALPAVYRANLEFQSHVPFQHSRMRFQGFAHMQMPRVLHSSGFIVLFCFLCVRKCKMSYKQVMYISMYTCIMNVCYMNKLH